MSVFTIFMNGIFRHRWLLLIFFMLLPFVGNCQIRQRVPVTVDVTKWITMNFNKGKLPPFSFVYNGKPSSSFLTKWNFASEKLQNVKPDEVKYQFTYSDKKSGLKVICEVTGFPSFQAVEWVLRFTNESDVNSGIIEQVKVSDYIMGYGNVEGDFTLYSANGSNGKRTDFMVTESILETGKNIYMAPDGGRSSDKTAFPFFNIVASGGETGVIGAIGWTGSWYADIVKKDENFVQLQSGMERMKLYLYPQETIRTPLICLLFWQGDDFMAGQNKFRRFVLAHHTRQIDGEFAKYPLAGGFNWGDPAPCGEYTCLTEDFALAIMKRYKQFGIAPDLYWLDAGWYEGCGGPDKNTSWWTAVGNWQVDSLRFPRGLKPLSDEAHKQNAKFMLWFEPERVMAGTMIAEEHPEWILKIPGDEKTFLFDLGNPDACKWLCEYYGKFIEDNGVDYYRQDFNIPAKPYWEANDEPERIGMKEIRHVENLYKFWDYLLTRFPNMLIDNCAAGGRRIDLETYSRAIPLWRTDYQYGEPNGYQCHTYGLNFFLPLHGTGLYKTDNFNFRSSLSSSTVMNLKLTELGVSIPDIQRVMKEYKDELRPYYYEDYYPLTGVRNLTGDDVWLAYQMHRPSDDSGIVVAFRRKDSNQDKIIVRLRGLNPDVTYRIYNDNTGLYLSTKGSELASGLTLNIDEAPGSLLLKYRPE